MFLRKVWGRIESAAWITKSDMQIQDPREFFKELSKPSKWWLTCRFWELFVKWTWEWNVDEVVSKILSSDARDIAYRHILARLYWLYKKLVPKNPSSVWEVHYDIDFALYEKMLWKFLKYTAPYWLDEYWEFDLDTAQMLCMEMICRWAQLSQWQKVLEVWFGYWTLANYMISNYWVEVTGLTVSDWQRQVANRVIDFHWNKEKARLNLMDWKKLYGTPEFEENYRWKFDRIVTIEMIEAVSTADLPLFFQFLYDCLNDDWVLFIQAINSDRLETTTEWFIDKYIFPDWVVPQEENLIRQGERAWFRTFSLDNSLWNPYDKALMQWWSNLEANKEQIKRDCNDPFKLTFPYKVENPMIKIFEYYLRSCAWWFRVWYNRDWHFVFHKSARTSTKIVIPTSWEVRQILNNKEWWDIQSAIWKAA